MNKTIVITGASKGIGLAIAQLFWNKKWSVALCARNTELLKKEFVSTSEQQAFIRSFDVKDRTALQNFGKEILNRFKKVDVLVNNAGQFIPGQIHEEAEGTLENMIETNLYSAYYLTKEIIGSMKVAKQGSIFNLCSVASLYAYPNGGSYSISKYALLGFSKSLREEMKAYNVKVTALIPGATLTNSWAGTDLPESRFIRASDIAQTVWDIEQLSPNTVVEEILLRPVLGDI